MQYARLQVIAVENFQSLRSRTEIPVGPLTLLYGPNSAGKSAVLDALTFVHAAMHADDASISQLIGRWINEGPKAARVEPMVVELELQLVASLFDVGYDFASDVPSELADVLLDLFDDDVGPFPKSLGRRVRLRLESETELSGVSVFLDEQRIVHWIDSGVDDPKLTVCPGPLASAFASLAERHDLDAEYAAPSDVPILLWHAPLRFASALHSRHTDRYDWDLSLVALANALLELVRRILPMPTVVDPDRTLIPDSDLAVVCGLESAAFNAPPGSYAWISEQRGSALYPLAQSHLASQIANESQRHPPQERAIEPPRFNLAVVAAAFRAASSVGATQLAERLTSFVNRGLGDHLFREAGYQICFDTHWLSSRARSDSVSASAGATGTEGRETSAAALLVGYLLDGNGRRTTFSDVGSGISCVVPVLTALHSTFSFVQQPELHLHPALQCSLADVFIEAIHGGDARHLVESHSEHLLLRCLRRIRETSSGKLGSGDALALRPNQVSLLYFEPLLDGSTTVKQIRISADGDFMDRWPRGFFEERWTELFDE